MVKIVDVKTKRGVDFAKHLSFYHCVCVCLPSYAAQRTYIFAAETEHDLKEWKAAMDNCMAKFISAVVVQ